jgi:hypothetical protein
MDSLEYVLWHALLHGPVQYGFCWVGPEQIAELRRLSEDCGGWITWSDDLGKEVFIPLESWLTLFDQYEIQRPQNPSPESGDCAWTVKKRTN